MKLRSVAVQPEKGNMYLVMSAGEPWFLLPLSRRSPTKKKATYLMKAEFGGKKKKKNDSVCVVQRSGSI